MRMSLRFPIAVVLSIVCLAAPARADFKAGVDAYHRGDYVTAIREWQPLAEEGHAVAQCQTPADRSGGKQASKDLELSTPEVTNG